MEKKDIILLSVLVAAVIVALTYTTIRLTDPYYGPCEYQYIASGKCQDNIAWHLQQSISEQLHKIIPRAMAQTQSPMVSLFCQAYRLNLAQSPQQGAMCGYLGNGQLLNQYQQNNGQLSSNPATNGVCPAGTFLSSNNQCLSSSTATNPVLCAVSNGQVITPLTVTVSTPSQTVSRGSPVTLTAVATPSIVSSGQGISSTCTQVTGTIQPGGYSWVQTSGAQVNATTTNLPTFVFTAPTVSTTLVFTVTVTDSNGQTTTSQPAIISVP